MFGRLLPKTTCFFDFFEQHIALTIQGAEELLALAEDGADRQARIARIKDLEHQTDAVTHQCIEALHRTFITPLDRGDIHRLIKRLDDIIDCMDAAVMRIGLYEIGDIRAEVREIAQVLVRATSEVGLAIAQMRKAVNSPEIQKHCVAVYHHENEGDTVLRAALARLFREERDPIMVIKWKEIFETLERAVDRCEDVANILQGVMIEAS